MLQPKILPRIENFEKLAYGLFLHYGLYSQLGRGEWVRYFEKIEKQEYSKLLKTFNPQDFDGRKIAKFAKDCGMRYICLTTRHHDGFSLYDTKGLCDFDSIHSPCKRDLVEEFVAGCRAEGIVPFFYHTTLDWYQENFENNFSQYIDYLIASVEILCRNYGTIGGLWFDGNWSKPKADWQEDRLYATIRKYQPEAIIVNNTGLVARGAVGHPEIDSVTYEQGSPELRDQSGREKYIAGEMCQTMNMHWGIGKYDFCYMSPKEIIERLCACRRVGANYLLNVGLTSTGQIPEYESAALLRVGQWLAMHGECLYNARPYAASSNNSDFVLKSPNHLYFFISNLGVIGDINVTSIIHKKYPRAFAGINDKIKCMQWLDNGERLTFTQNNDGLLCFDATGYPYGTNLVVRIAKAEI
ncbi:MAG: Alpha-L-fucosidase [Planctomycetes bacterium ADurb.Bin401]|nr:MAG: Alpha-L-fucosidase [Planctomycetes bacterium ADurb.Bin401]